MTPQLPERLVAALDKPRPVVTVVCGLGGGGEGFAHAVIEAMSPGVPPTDLIRQELPYGCCYSWPGGRLVDLAARAGLGRLRRPGDCLVPGDGGQVYLVRDRASARWIADTDVVDLTESDDGGREPRRTGVLAAWCAPATVDSLFDEICEGPGPALLDIGRILCLFRPRQLDCDDLWAELASRMSGRAYSVSDISMCVFRYPGLFDSRWLNDRLAVRPSCALAVNLLEGHAQPTQSEHRRLYLVLRDLAVAQLARGYPVPAAVRSQLPRQAAAGGVVGDLAMDALALLCCDPAALVAELERDPAHMRRYGARALLLCAQRLFAGRAPASHLELSGYRIGLEEFGEAIQGKLPGRPWRTVWARGFSVHTNRVLLSRTCATLALCTTQAGPPAAPAMAGPLAEVFGGCSDGTLWRLRPYGLPKRIWHDPEHPAEIRAVAAVRTADSILVGTGASDHSVAVINGVSGQLKWRDERAHTDPVSVVTVAGTPDAPVLVSAGVSSKIWLHQMCADRPQGRLLYAHNSEIRGLAAVDAGDAEFIVFAAVDGGVGIVDASTGRLAGISEELTVVLNGVAAARNGDELVVVGGTSSGQVVMFRCALSGLLAGNGAAGDDAGPVPLAVAADLTSHDSAVNCVRLVRHRGQLAAVSTSSDHGWRWTWLSDGRSTPLIGHAGPVWSAAAASHDGRLYVVTAGGEGDCRAWQVDSVLHEKMALGQLPLHRGGVTAIGVTTNASGQICVVTGDGEGEVRAWPVGDANGGGKLVEHATQISALSCGYRSADGSLLQVVSGSLDGPLWLTVVRDSAPPASVILGIAHEGVTALTVLDTDGRQILVSGGLDGTVTTWDLERRVTMGTVTACRFGAVQSLCATGPPADQRFVVGGQDGSVSLRDVRSLSEIRYARLDSAVLGLSPIPGLSAGWVAALANGQIAVVRGPGSNTDDISHIPAHKGEVRAVSSFLLGGRQVVASAGLDRRLRLFDLDTRQRLLEVELEGYATCLAAASGYLAVSSSTGAAVFSFAATVPGLTEAGAAEAVPDPPSGW